MALHHAKKRLSFSPSSNEELSMKYVSLNIDPWCEKVNFDTDIVVRILSGILEKNKLSNDLVSDVVFECSEENPFLFFAHVQFDGEKQISHPLYPERTLSGNSKKVSMIISAVVANQLMYVLWDSYQKDIERLGEDAKTVLYPNIKDEFECYEMSMAIPKLASYINAGGSVADYKTEFVEFVEFLNCKDLTQEEAELMLD